MTRQELIKSLEKLTLVHKILIVTGLVVVLGAGYWYFFLSPQLDNMIKLHKDIATINKDIDRFTKVSLQLPALEKKVQAKQTEFLFAQTLLPEDAQALESLLASFEMVAQEMGVSFMSFTSGKQTVTELYASRSVSLRLRGSFHNLMRFFDTLSRLDRLVQLDSLRLQPVGKQQDNQVSVLTADSILVVFRALTPQERAANQAGKTKK
ncbi:type 4a pilus biogenesis protein PilO [Desulfoplanes sp. PS50]